MALPLETEIDYVKRWLEEIARNTAQSRDALLKRGGAGGKGVAADADPDGTRFERAMEALGKRFESALSKWSRTPVEALVNASFDKGMQVLNTATQTVLSTSRNFAQRGMQGTVEQAKLDYANEQLARQFAAIMAPLTGAMTYFSARVGGLMQGLNGEGQNRLLGMGIGAVAGGRAAGAGGAIAGGVLGPIAMRGDGTGGTGDMFMGAGAGAYLGFRAGGAYGAVAGTAAGAAAATPRSYVTERPSDYYDRMRAGGGSMVGSTLSTMAESLARPFRGATPGAPPPPGATPPTPRRDVTPFSAEMGDAGSAYFKAQTSAIRATAGADFEDAGPLKPIVDMMVEIIKLLAKLANVELTEPPRGADAARR